MIIKEKSNYQILINSTSHLYEGVNNPTSTSTTNLKLNEIDINGKSRSIGSELLTNGNDH